MGTMLSESFSYEKTFESEKWVKEIPFLKFKSEWDVKVIPPFCGAVVRFLVKFNDKEISVYLDCYNNLGAVGKPYWEIYPYVNDDVYRCYMNETENLLHAIDITLNKTV